MPAYEYHGEVSGCDCFGRGIGSHGGCADCGSSLLGTRGAAQKDRYQVPHEPGRGGIACGATEADTVCARCQLPESPVVHRHKIADIFELRLLEQHPKRECCGHLMLAEFRIWAVAIDIRHHAVTEAKIDSIPFSALHIGNVL